jgi:membrane protease YdiL (CAAX protease family)
LAAELVRARLLLRATAFLAAVATGLVVPPSPSPGFLAGPAIGTALFVILARDRPHLPERPVAVVVVRGGYLFAAAAFEELLWRGLGLALLADLTGPLLALVLTSCAFALWHRRSCGRQSAVHVVTGLGFGGAFFAGGLVAAILAHASYNVLVDLSVQAKRARERGP